MKKLKSMLVTLAMLLCCISVGAHDFEVDGIYYNITDSEKLTLEVTYQGSNYYSYSNEYTGEVVIPETVTYESKTYSVTSIGNNAFSDCRSLTTVTIPNCITSIGSSTFSGCSSLTSTTIPNSVKSISYCAFSYCGSLTSITIPDGVTCIGEQAFYGCSNLTSITIPNSVTCIDEKAFSRCSSLTSITVESGNSKYDSRDNCNAIIETETNTLVQGCDSTKIPNSVVRIDDNAFYGCISLTSITIPNSVTRIGTHAFYDCSSLTSITIPDGVTIIGSYAFSSCNSLNSITIPYGITSIGNYTFSYCSSLTSINIPNSVTSIGNYAFYCCSNLPLVTIPNSVTNIDFCAFRECTSLTSITIPISVRRISSQTFSGCSSLTSVTIPNSVTSIGEEAFDGCSGLTSVTIPDGITKIEKSTFSGCSSLTSVTIGNSVTSIGEYAFSGCRSLNSITIPNSVTNISEMAFSGCSGLTSITIYNSVRRIGEYAFSGCRSLNSITIPNSVTSIGTHAFYGCSNLTSITVESGNSMYDSRNNCNAIIETETNNLLQGCNSTKIPNSVVKIDDNAFYGSVNLTSITIPNSITNIGYYAFEGCENLVDFYCLSEIVPLAESKCFGNTISINATLYVPAASIDAYKSTEPWSYFETIKELPAHEIVMNNNISTYCYPNDLDFTNVEGLKAFVASSYDDVNEKVQMTRINKVPAETGIILTGNTRTYNVAYATSKVATDFTNLLKGVTIATIIGPSSDGFLNYILAKGTNGIGFYPASEGTLAAGKAYLQLPSSVSSAKGISMSFEDETTGICDNYEVEIMNSDVAVYDLQGRKVKNPTKGLYIVNGKKVVIK